MKGERIEKVIIITKDRDYSDKYPGQGQAFDLEDEDGIQYEWNTMTDPDLSIHKDQKWLVKMTIERQMECLGFPFTRVKNVRFVKQITD